MPNLTYHLRRLLAAFRAFLWSLYHDAGQMPRVVEAECRATLRAVNTETASRARTQRINVYF